MFPFMRPTDTAVIFLSPISFIHLWNFTMFWCAISKLYLNAAGSNTCNKFLGEGEINW